MSDELPILVSQAEREKIATAPLPPQELHPKTMTINLTSAGRLSVPAKVAIRDYSMDDATRIAMATEGTMLPTIMTILGSVTQGQIDVGELHTEEAKEILVTILLNFWNSYVERYPYEVDEKDYKALQKKDPAKAARVLAGLEYLWCLVPLTDASGKSLIKTKPLPEKFKEPFGLKDAMGNKFLFRLPRMKDDLKAKQVVDAKYAQFDQEFFDIQEALGRIDKLKESLATLSEDLVRPEGISDEDFSILQAEQKVELAAARSSILEVIQSISPTRKRIYDERQKERALDIIRYKHAFSLVGENGRLYESDDQRIEAYDRISVAVWKNYARVLDENKFGIDSKIQVKSPVTGGLVDREIRFRLVDLVPTIGPGNDGELEVSYGEVS